MSELRFLEALRADHELFQTSTVQALLDGAYDGDVSVGELLEHGELGLGTLDGLDGELIIVDGEAFKAEVDATLTRPALDARTPFAVVAAFTPGPALGLAAGGMDDLDAQLGAAAERGARAVRIDGAFDTVRVRSVARQNRPYPPLAEALAHQRVTDLDDVRGTMVGFCFPDPLGGVEIAGWHLHFATADRSRGGHVLGFALRSGTARLDTATALRVELPPGVEAPGSAAEGSQALLDRLERG